MFRRNPFTKLTSSPSSSSRGSRTPVSPFANDLPIPENEVAASTPIPERPPLYTSDSWNDPPMSWTSQAAAYDVNPRYTTANQSYTHRRRKSSVIKHLVMGGDEGARYQPAYQDWRDGVRTPESDSEKWDMRHAGLSTERSRGAVVKVLASFLLVISIVLGGLWVYGGEMPLVATPDTRVVSESISKMRMNAADAWKSATSNINITMVGDNVAWHTSKIQEKIKGAWSLNQDVHSGLERVKRWITVSTALRPSNDPRGDERSSPVTVTVTSTSGGSVNPDLTKFMPETLATMIKSARATQTKASNSGPAVSLITPTSTQEKESSATVLGTPVQVKEVPSDGIDNVIPEPLNIVEEKDDENEKRPAQHGRTGEMWRKHADPGTGDSEVDEQLQSFAGTLADGVSPATET
ncbi:hypothetical protein LTS08_005999 [Lithohypha guttulata]|nr:hypothetical protein LTS08_005999 [Lithohypha guttulata]